jgi:hypothetical protein
VYIVVYESDCRGRENTRVEPRTDPWRRETGLDHHTCLSVEMRWLFDRGNYMRVLPFL